VGPEGPKGPTGPEGPKGATGKSVTVSSIPVEEEECEERGGALVQQEGALSGVEVCNGAPWTAGGTLPSSKTWTGGWAFGKTTAGGEVHIPISFPLPLATALGESGVHFLNKAGKEIVLGPSFEPLEETSTKCLGTASAPSAAAGNLCIYTSAQLAQEKFFAASNFSIKKIGSSGLGTSTTGALLTVEAEAAGSEGYGTWAVTAP
jgi:hypothetical protein